MLASSDEVAYSNLDSEMFSEREDSLEIFERKRTTERDPERETYSRKKL